MGFFEENPADFCFVELSDSSGLERIEYHKSSLIASNLSKKYMVIFKNEF